MEIGFRQRPLWLLPLLLVLAAQAALTLGQFGSLRPCRALLDDRPVVNGRHTLHLYHGFLGARSWVERGTGCCYDPAFQAGYPKTPLFDSGSRMAELCLLAGGAAWRPAAYKIGLALVCLLVPAAFALVARLVGLSPAAACLAAGLGLPLTWSGPARKLLVEGDVDLWLGSLMLLVHFGALVGFHRRSSVLSWVALTASAAVGWFVSPLTFAIALLPAAFFQLAVLTRHELGWHLAVVLASGGAVAGNLAWLADWHRHWWVRLPLLADVTAVPPTPVSLEAIWAAPCWGACGERSLAVGLFALGVLGLFSLAGGRRSATAGLLGAGLLGTALAGAGEWLWPDLKPLGPSRLLAVAPWFAVVPALVALGRARRALGVAGLPLLGVLLAGAGASVVAGWSLPTGAVWEVGLSAERLRLAAILRERTSPDGRILWEDRADPTDTRWAALLPELTGRSFLGGLDPVGEVEHSFARLAPDGLAGRPLDDWEDLDLDRFCSRYNVGWVACWSPAAVRRFARYPAARAIARLPDGSPGVLYVVDRTRSLVLKGKAEVVELDRRRVVLRSVEPEDGVVVLSLHWQGGWRATPGSAHPERDPDPFDPVPLLRLRLNGPVACLTLVWDNP